MGNSFPCLARVHIANVPKASEGTKQKLHNRSILLSRLKELKKSKAPGTGSDQIKGGKKAVIRVKVVLTRKEAAQLLSACAQGEKSMAEIMSKVKRMEHSHVSKHSLGSSHAAWRPALESIPEELSDRIAWEE